MNDQPLDQRGEDVMCIYCAIGQRGASVARDIAQIEEHGAMAPSIVVVAAGEDPPGLQFIAAYAATSIAEHFMEQGREVLIVYDDLTRHARACRELSLLLRRPPGREAYPGDIFFIHSRLPERATHLRENLPELAERIEAGKKLSDEDRETLAGAAREAIERRGSGGRAEGG